MSQMHTTSMFEKLPSTANRSGENQFDANVEACKGRVIAFNTSGIGTGFQIYQIDASATRPVYVNFQCYVDTAFNGGSTNVLTLGTTLGGTEIFAAGDIDETTVGANTAKMIKLTARTKIYVKFAQTGTPATTGAATFFATIRWAKNR